MDSKKKQKKQAKEEAKGQSEAQINVEGAKKKAIVKSYGIDNVRH